MALVKCTECGKEISSNAEACPNCGNPTRLTTQTKGTYCPRCKTHVTPVVTSVGGGTCSFGKRETWKCPNCFRVLHRSGCFIATISYGDEDFVEVLFLRAFRDRVLSQSSLGQSTIWIYYHLGPFAAKVVESAPFLKPFCRRILDCTITVIEKRTGLKRDTYRSRCETEMPKR
jgi:hypothetical protein